MESTKPTTNYKPSIPLGEHVLICGQTGTGKTFLAETYLAGYKESVVMLDTKGQYWERKEEKKSAWIGLKENRDFVMVDRLKDLPEAGEKFNKIIYTPVHSEMSFEHYNSFFEWVYNRKHTVAWVDEVMSVCPNTMKLPEYYRAILTRGRSRRTSVWSLSQRPSGIPNLIISESKNVFCYDLQLPQDREKMANITGVKEFLTMPGYRKFWYWHAGEMKAIKATLQVRR